MKRALVLVLLLGAGAAYLLGPRYLWPAQSDGPLQTVGILEAQEVNLTSRIAGRIAQLDLVEGDRVKKGQVLCRIEDIDLRNQLAKAEADLAHDQATAANSALTAARERKLFAAGVVSTQERDNALAQSKQDRAAVLSAKADVDYYRDQIKDTAIRAPMDGVVVNKALEVGEWVTPGVPILTIDDLGTIWARVDVQETDLPDLYMGKAAEVTLPTNPPEIFSGQIMAIGQEGEFATEHDVRRGRQDIRTFFVKVRLLQAGNGPMPGMTAEVSFMRDGNRLAGNQR